MQDQIQLRNAYPRRVTQFDAAVVAGDGEIGGGAVDGETVGGVGTAVHNPRRGLS